VAGKVKEKTRIPAAPRSVPAAWGLLLGNASTEATITLSEVLMKYDNACGSP
jgi:hypothetical protein